MVSVLHDWWSYSSTVAFLLFLGCWTTFVATPYLAAAPIWAPRLAHRIVIPAVEVVTMIFWFAGFIAIGAELPSPAGCVWSTCHALQATTVFGAFEWYSTSWLLRDIDLLTLRTIRVLFMVTSYFAIIDLLQHRSSGETAHKTQHNAHLGV